MSDDIDAILERLGGECDCCEGSRLRGAAVALGLIAMGQTILANKLRSAKSLREMYELTGETKRFDDVMTSLLDRAKVAIYTPDGADKETR